MSVSPVSFFVTCCETYSDSLYQVCYMPIPLMKLLKLCIEDVVYLKLGEKGLICQVLPKPLSKFHSDFGVLASNQGIHNVYHLRDIHLEKEYEISVNNVTLATVTDIQEISISVIMKSVDDVVKAKKNLCNFKKSITSLVQLFKIMEHSVISCFSNPLAKFLGISYMIINNIIPTDELKNKTRYVGKIISKTIITILNIESEERHFNLVKNYSCLGGLEMILKDFKCMIFENWNNPVNKKKSISVGILLVGPPGCGKSSLVRQICYETKTSYISTAAAELQSPYEGETLKNFEKVAKKACSLSREGPCIFFIDEIDSLSFAKTRESSSYDIDLINQALSILDDCKRYPFLLVIAATNRPYVLDKSFRTSGRLEREILLSAPTLNQREKILNIYCKGLLPDSHPMLRDVAIATPGFVGADLKYLCEKVREKFPPNELSFLNIELIYKEILRLASTISPSIHKSLEFFTEKPKFSQVGGLSGIKRSIDKILFYHSRYEKFYKNFGIKKPRGILFYGPRGCGKNRLVSFLASRKGYSFISANACNLLSPYVGESEKKVASLFHSARLAQPSIIFIDEIDGIFGTRESTSHGVRVNIITELLQAMDGVAIGAMSQQGTTEMGNNSDVQDDILVCAATNYPEKLDSALIRPGRFDHLIYIPPPDRESRLEILKLKSSTLKFPENVLEEIADKTENWTGTELENLIVQVIEKICHTPNFDMNETPINNIPEEILWDAFSSLTCSLSTQHLNRYQKFALKYM